MRDRPVPRLRLPETLDHARADAGSTMLDGGEQIPCCHITGTEPGAGAHRLLSRTLGLRRPFIDTADQLLVETPTSMHRIGPDSYSARDRRAAPNWRFFSQQEMKIRS